MTPNRKLRLVVTGRCHNSCPMCCNNRFDLSKLPVVQHWDYDEIMITGGEPLLFSSRVLDLIIAIKNQATYTGKNPKIYLYTALPGKTCWMAFNLIHFNLILSHIDGIVVTPHTTDDLQNFIRINNWLLRFNRHSVKSLRLNLFPEVKRLLPEDTDLSLWKIKDMQWIKDCPVPEGEDLQRINHLFK